jgi:peptidoglycan/xylan/chitin deacetylase (PgdA/CDA1 family)
MKKVLLSFDIEEFDMPLEYGMSLSFKEQIEVSAQGTKVILDILGENKLKATFFSTVVFASHAPELIQRIGNEGHELASHGYFHSRFQNSHLAESKTELERLSGLSITGFRRARMMPVDIQEIQHAGYLYDSSLNPVYLPGRYNNAFKSRTLFMEQSVMRVPASATPFMRLPLFWLSFHNLPLRIYKAACSYTINHDSYLNIYFHPWEFLDLTNPSYGLPKFISKNSGDKMIMRFSNLIRWMKAKGYLFNTLNEFVAYKCASKSRS